MGIKHFFSWFRRHPNLKKCISSRIPRDVDHVLVDMNGVIHEAAQKVYRYGKYANAKPSIVIPRRLKHVVNIKKENLVDVKDFYDCVKAEVNKIVETINVSKTIFLAIDGVAPKSKQNQQRQRRFRAAKEKNANDESFDSTCITAGTQFMRDLATKLRPFDWINSNADVFLSDDSVPGEGEHKLMDWIRKSDDIMGTFCVVGMDADLILLCAVSEKKYIYIMRENEKKGFDYINVSKLRDALPVDAHDLVIWSCFIGNDFLPPIPTLEIKESYPEMGALDFLFQEYRRPLVNKKNGRINFKEISRLLKIVKDREQSIMEARANDESEDPDDYTRRIPNYLWKGDIDEYRTLYHEKKLHSMDPKQIVYDFMKTVQWVYTYYTKGIKSWDWFYPHNYVLHASAFVDHMPFDIVLFGFKGSKPSHPHEQLLRVLPASSKHLLPEYLHEELEKICAKYTTFEIDASGKRQQWEATTIVDFVDIKNVEFR